MTAAPEREIGNELTGALHDSTGSYELVIAAVAAAGFGFLIDRAFGIMPVFTLIFAIAGFIGAGYSLWLKYREQMAGMTAERLARTGSASARAATSPATEDRA